MASASSWIGPHATFGGCLVGAVDPVGSVRVFTDGGDAALNGVVKVFARLDELLLALDASATMAEDLLEFDLTC